MRESLLLCYFCAKRKNNTTTSNSFHTWNCCISIFAEKKEGLINDKIYAYFEFYLEQTISPSEIEKKKEKAHDHWR